MVMSALRCPSNFITAGRLTPARIISVPNECRLVGDKALGDPDGGDDVSPELAQLGDELVAATGTGQQKAISGEVILGTQQTEAIHQATNEGIHRNQAIGFQLAKGNMNGPTLWADMAETIEGQIGAL